MIEIHPSLLKRKIIHFDMDAFYASIEVRDDPKLKGRPVVVGGSPNSRAVVCTANYEARRYGIYSAMPCSQALRLCAEAVFIRPNFEKYVSASLQIREIFKKYTSLIEPLSLDEAYLDVTNNEQGLYAVKIAQLIQNEIYEMTGLTGSAGIAPNKLLAKIASDMRKPKGMTIVLPGQAIQFMQDLPLRKIHGIGPVAEKRLLSEGMQKCKDVWSYSLRELQVKLGKRAEWLYNSSRGIDERPVEPKRIRKSLGQEETFAVDILSVDELKVKLSDLSHAVSEDLQNKNLKGRTIILKVKYSDFTQVTRRKTFNFPVEKEAILLQIGTELLTGTEAGKRKIRLLGLSVSNWA
jgi:DNA polymerase IV